MIEETPAVVAQDLSLIGDEGRVFGPLNCTIPAGGLTNLTGAGGSGRTALALVLAGRMKPTGGELTVVGETKRARIQKRVAVAGIEQIDLLERSVTVRDVLNENRSWERPWWQFFRRATEEDLRYYCQDLYGERDLPPLDSYISQLPALDKLLLRVALALKPAHGHEIDMLIMDDLEQVHRFADRNFLLRRLEDLSQYMTVVVNSVNPIDDCVHPRAVIELNTNAGHFTPTHTGLPSTDHHSPDHDANGSSVAASERKE
ncbi:ATP-binding cassette domain-containing protein [Corynebacterium auriscanis]|uniref:ATP-binding cassette domain-containing protein n=1 Tax=Corynebacterium auriscanis TaxID=99807 RepID=UPI003CF69E60